MSFDSKFDNLAISPARFDPKLGGRTKQAILITRGIWLDNDGLGMTWAQFAAIFPRWEMVCYNTYSSTNEHPRWRVYIPTSQLMTAKAQKALLDIIYKRL